jgi:hypothetical protein
MICSRKPSRHKPSKKPPNLREQTKSQATSLEKSLNTAPKSRLATTASSQRRPSLSRDARSHLSAKKETAGLPKQVPQPRHNLDRQMPVATFVVARAACCSTFAVTSRQSKRAPTAVQGKLLAQSGRAFALRIAEARASLLLVAHSHSREFETPG